MKILAIDTALGAASACVFDGADFDVLAIESLAMERGHAEALMPLLDRVTARVEGGFGALARVAVTVGPGSFTGLRVGIAAARAIGLACEIPVVGVSTLAALAAPLILEQGCDLVAAAIDARHGKVYFAVFDLSGRAIIEPQLAAVRDAAAMLGSSRVRLAGSGAALVAIEAGKLGVGVEIDTGNLYPDIVFIARLGLLADPLRAPPRPLYLKAPDATPKGVAPEQDRAPAQAPTPQPNSPADDELAAEESRADPLSPDEDDRRRLSL